MTLHGLIEKGDIVEFPVLQTALAAIKSRSDPIVVHSLGFGGGEKEDVELFSVSGRPSDFHVRLRTDSVDYLDWLNSAFLRAGLVEPVGLQSVATELAEHEDLILGVDTNLLPVCIVSEHLMETLFRIHARPYRESVNWILLVIPGVVMKELENAANQKKAGHLTHAGRMGYRALQEITVLKRTEGFQGMSVLVAGETNPDRLHLSPDGMTIMNADSMIRDQFKAFLRGIEFRKGVFFLTMDKTNASLAAAEGLAAVRIQHPHRLRKGDELMVPHEQSVLLARVLYEVAVEFGDVRVAWRDGQEHRLDLAGAWTWKSMEHWEGSHVLCTDMDAGFHKALNRYTAGQVDPRRLQKEWERLAESFHE